MLFYFYSCIIRLLCYLLCWCYGSTYADFDPHSVCLRCYCVLTHF